MKKFTFFILIFITHYSLFITHCSSQWVYQSLPAYHQVQDLKFFDENTGILIYYDYPADVGILRTTNGGFNWTLLDNTIHYYDIQKIDNNTIYLVGRSLVGAIDRIQRTFDRGLTWDSVSLESEGGYTGISFINRDTGWISGANGSPRPCIWKTINGGATLIQQTDTTGIGKIFFLKNKVNGEYYGWHYSSDGDNKFWKTTNSGNNWFQVARPQGQYLYNFAFIDENTGWFTGQWGIFKTTNGGLNWTLQTLPSGNGIQTQIFKFKIINYDTLYGGGGIDCCQVIEGWV
jgi:photosystem II stability/assembly factor-like uncharacterized protein